MRKIVLSATAAVAVCAAALVPLYPEHSAQAEVAPPNGAPTSFADLSEALLPAVVNVSTTQKVEAVEQMPEMPEFPPGSPFEDFFNDFMERRGQMAPDTPTTSLGSGFIIDAAKGYIVTNNHVVRDAQNVRVTLHDDTTLDAEIVGTDEKTDLAVLKVKPTKKLVAVPFGASSTMRVGDWVLAIGNPFGLGGTVTQGIISARKRDINAGPYDDFLQTDASINRGNSGGPMFNLKGEVIGINTAIFSPSGGSVGIGFAIPSDLAKPVIAQLIEFGKTRRGWIGVRIQSVTDEIAESLGLEKAQGALVAGVTPKGPAETAKLEPGDVILTFNGQPISDMRSLPRLVAETPIKSTAELTYWRNGKIETTKITVGELEKAEADGLISGAPTEEPAKGTGVKVESVGMTLSALTDAVRAKFGISADIAGVVVTDVVKGSESATKGLEPGDVILEVNQQGVDNPHSVAETIESARKAGRSSVLLLVDREGKGDVRFVALRLKK